MSVKDIVGATRWAEVKTSLENCWPDERSEVTDELVDELFRLAKHEWKAPDLAALALDPPTIPAKNAAAPPGRFYLAHGTHIRHTAPDHAFTGELPMIRFDLPQHGTSTTVPTIATEGGDALGVDRLYPSIDTFWARYEHDPLLTFARPERVELTTPPRLRGARFGAIAIYLAYAKASDTAPCFYVLEAGLATGQPRIAYLGRTMDWTIITQSHYDPTPFSGRSHWYRGRLFMQPADPAELDTLTVEVFEQQPPKDPAQDKASMGHYMTVSVRYEPRPEPVMTNPFFLTIAAGARLSAIADALGIEIEVPQRWLMRLIAKDNADTLFSKKPVSG
ncbi:MAG: hypothetical protein AB8I08_21315 [Sandaracinaceae bacterium]